MEDLGADAACGLNEADEKAGEIPAAFFTNADRPHSAGFEFGTKGTVLKMQHADFVAIPHKAAREQHELALGATVTEIANDKGDLHDCGSGRWGVACGFAGALSTRR